MTRIVLTSSEYLSPRHAVNGAVGMEHGSTSSDSGVAVSGDQMITDSSTSRSDHRQRLEPSTWEREVPEAAEVPYSTEAATPASIQRHLDDPWFLSHDSWQIYPSPGNADSISFLDSGLEYFIASVRRWLDQWLKEGHNVFIHPRLYGGNGQLPDCLGDAYAAYTTYCSATSANKKVALRVAGGFAKRLVENQNLFDDLEAETLDIQSHLSRTQALLVFQIIRLFDGDIRSRADAEADSSTLLKWSYQLMHRAASVSSNIDPGQRDSGDDLSQQQPSPTAKTYPHTLSLQSDGTVASTWRAWVLSESIRRTWIIATLTEAAYAILKHGFATCPGTISFTSRAGLWDATSPQQWLSRLGGDETGYRALSEDHGFPLTCADVPGLLTEAQPDQIDDLTHKLIIYSVGCEEWNDWKESR